MNTHPQLYMQLQAYLLLLIAENRIVEKAFSVHALPTANGVTVCFSSAQKDVSYLCQEGSGTKTPCMACTTPSLCYSRLAVHFLTFIAQLYVPFSLYTTGTVYVFSLTAENRIVRKGFNISAPPDANGVPVCFSSAQNDVSCMCQEGSDTKISRMTCIACITPFLCYSRLAA